MADEQCTEVESEENLMEYVDMIITYKCKFCSFSCNWKSGLFSHIRSTHITLVDKMAGKSSPEGQTESCNNEIGSGCCGENDEVTIPQSATEQQLYACGLCDDVIFEDLKLCKEHMVKEHEVKHDVKVEKDTQIEETKPKVQRRSNRGGPSRTDAANQDATVKTAKKKNVTRPKGPQDSDPAKKRATRRNLAQDRKLRCTVQHCGCRFKNAEKLSYHAKCHSANAKSFSCPECEAPKQVTNHWRLMASHLWKSHNIDCDLFSCSACEYKTHSAFKLANHERIHSDERKYACDTCSKTFKQLGQLRNHKVIHLDRSDPANKHWFNRPNCSLCDRDFSDAKALRKHLQAVHNKEKPFACSYCDYRSARKAMLELHERQHTGEKPFACDLCDYKTGDHNSLRRHKMRHKGTKPYQCPHCPYASIQAVSFKSHMKNKHPGLEGLFCCPYCSYRSVSETNLNGHVGTHTEDEKSKAAQENAQNEYEEGEVLSHCETLDDGSEIQVITIHIPNEEEILSDNGQYFIAVQPDIDMQLEEVHDS